MLADAEQPVADRIAAALRDKPDGILESVAAQCGATLRQVMEHLPPGAVKLLPGDCFETVWAELTQWGDVLLIVHTPDIVLECEGPMPTGSFGHGYYNIHGDSPIGGHIKAGKCRAIYLVDRSTAQGRVPASSATICELPD